MMVDIALEPRSVMAANVAKAKNQKSNDLHAHLAQFDPFANTTEFLLRTAYGYNGLGMPRLGLKKNMGNIDSRMLQQFVMDNVTPRIEVRSRRIGGATYQIPIEVPERRGSALALNG